MGYLLSFGVITFQIAILVSIICAGRLGKKALVATTLGWISFTLFGSIFTAGLLLFQLATIGLAYSIGKNSSSVRQERTPVTRPTATRSGSSWLVTAIVVFVAIAAGMYFGRQSAQADLEQLKHIRAAPVSAKSTRLRQDESWRVRQEDQDEEAKRRLLERTPDLGQFPSPEANRNQMPLPEPNG